MSELVIADQLELSKMLAPSDLLPDAYRGKPANVLVAIQYGQALGLEPMAAIQGINVIKGKPTASAQLIGGLVRRAGHKLRVTGDSQQAVCEIVRCDDPDFTFRSVWTLDRAKQAGLTGNPSWQKFPDAMLKARAITECARDACPEALSGVAYTAEELEPTKPVYIEQPVVAPIPFDAETGEVMEAEIVEPEPEVEVEPQEKPALEWGAIIHGATSDNAETTEFEYATEKQIGAAKYKVKNWVKAQVGIEKYPVSDADMCNLAHKVLGIRFANFGDLSKKQASKFIEECGHDVLAAWWTWKQAQK